MTLDEAIKYYKYRYEESRNFYKYLLDIDEAQFASDYESIAEEYKQTVEWLRELVAYRKLRICGNCRHYVNGTTHFGECHVTSNIEPCVVCVNQNACDTFFDYKDFKNGV